MGILVLLVLILLGIGFFFVLFTFFLRVRNEREARLWAELKTSWEPALLEILADPEKTQPLWDQVGPGQHLLFLEFILRYAQRLGGAEKEILQKVADPYLPDIVPRLNHRLMSSRVRAVQTLGTLGLPRFLPELKTAIGDPSPFVAAMAARLLAHEVGAEAAPELCASLERLKNFRTWYLADMMVAMGPGAVPTIREALGNENLPPRTRAVAAHSLSVLMDLGSADLAAKLAAKENDPELVTTLLRLLAQVGTTAHQSAARAHLDSQEFFIRAAATRTVAELGSREDLPVLIEKLSDSSSWVRLAAARGVYRLGGRETLLSMTRRDDPSAPLFRQVLAEEGGE